MIVEMGKLDTSLFENHHSTSLRTPKTNITL